MGYNGYFKLGEVEIINSARVKAYVDSASPSFGLQGCDDCEGLPAALGTPNGYTSPLVDRAPWMDSSNVDLGNFWGVYPLAVDGLDDSTRTTTVTELTTDGAVMSIPRARAREIRYDVMLVGADAAAVDAGFHWLNRALDAVRCDNLDLGCTGTDLDFYSTCPPLCDFSECVDNPLDFNYLGVNNLFSYQPAIDEAARWSGQGGGGVRINGALGPANCEGLISDFPLAEGRIQRGVTGFIVGETYVATLDVRFLIPGMRWGISGIGFVEAGSYTDLGSCDGGMQFEFVATQNNHQVYMELNPDHPGIPDGNTPSSLAVTWIGAHIIRTSPNRLTYQTYFPEDGTITNGWAINSALTAAQGGQSSTYRSNGTLGISWSAPTPGSSPAGVMLSRPIRGLTVGNQYRFSISGYQSGSLDGLNLQAIVVGGDAGDMQLQPQPGGRWSVMVEFVATAPSATIALYKASASTGVLDILLNAASVTDITVEPAPSPNPSRRYERTLFQVTALTGPTITERYDKHTGSMMRVSFGLVAGVPHHFGPMSRVGSAIGGTAFPVPEITCSAGQPVRINFMQNPSFETNLTGWAVTFSGGSGTQTRPISPTAIGAADYPLTQQYVNRVVWPSAMGSLRFDGNNTGVDSAGAYILSMYVRSSKAVQVEATVFGQDAVGGNAISQASGIFQITAGLNRWTRIAVPIVVGAGVVNLWTPVEFRGLGGTDLPFEGQIEIDGLQVEFGNTATDFFTGSYNNAAWAGTPNASRSVYTPPVTSEMIDPDCPPLPTPPAPPEITNSCVEDPDAWTRYAINVPATDIPLFSSALPVVTISTGNVAARQVRMRWYRNPLELTVSEINPCDFEGEIIASYVPPFAEMEINSITRTAQAVVDGGLPQVGTQLLYGPDGGPMIWPELSCNIPYVFTVDVEPDGDVANLDVRLDLGLKV